MFDHSIKVPRLYKTASKLAKNVSEGKGSIKQLVYESKHPNIKALYALVVHAFQRTETIENILKKSKLLVKEPRFDPWLAKILITELLWGKKRLSGQAKPIQTILAYEQILKAHLSDVLEDEPCVEPAALKPRYVRINTIKWSVPEAVTQFRDEGWILKRYLDDNYAGFLEVVTNLGSEEFMVDFHVPYLLIFPPKTQFYQHPTYLEGKIILQDKASCLPVHILNPEPGSTVLDMCAAPGMKTTQCAAILENKGKIYAVEVGKKRFETLNKLVETSGATCVTTINEDVLTLTDEQYSGIEYIIIDPSCSGSGITDRVEIGQQESRQHEYRLEKLAGFQIKMLRYALTRFPKVKRVVYSTCSIYPEENEDVVRQVLETCTSFKMVPADQFLQKKWLNFGSSEFGNIGNFSLYAKPDIDLTSGFFVAVFERLESGEFHEFFNKNLFALMKKELKEKKRREKRSKRNADGQDEISVKVEKEEEQTENREEVGAEKKKKRKKKSKDVEDVAQHTIKQEVDETIAVKEIKKEKIKEELCVIEDPEEDQRKKKKQKKRRKSKEEEPCNEAVKTKKKKRKHKDL